MYNSQKHNSSIQAKLEGSQPNRIRVQFLQTSQNLPIYKTFLRVQSNETIKQWLQESYLNLSESNDEIFTCYTHQGGLKCQIAISVDLYPAQKTTSSRFQHCQKQTLNMLED